MPEDLAKLLEEAKAQERLRRSCVCAECESALIRRQRPSGTILECYHFPNHTGIKKRRRPTMKELWESGHILPDEIVAELERKRIAGYRKEEK